MLKFLKKNLFVILIVLLVIVISLILLKNQNNNIDTFAVSTEEYPDSLAHGVNIGDGGIDITNKKKLVGSKLIKAATGNFKVRFSSDFKVAPIVFISSDDTDEYPTGIETFNITTRGFTFRVNTSGTKNRSIKWLAIQTD
jgi:hypothetical protein